MALTPDQQTSLISILIVWSGAFLLTLWISLVIWVYRDINNRTDDPFQKTLSVLAVLLLFIPGGLIYLLTRPSNTVQEDFLSALKEESLLHSIDGQFSCKKCDRQLNREWKFCPECYERVSDLCSSCGEHLQLEWRLCPYCGVKKNHSRARKVGQPQSRVKNQVESIAKYFESND